MKRKILTLLTIVSTTLVLAFSCGDDSESGNDTGAASNFTLQGSGS